VARLRVQTFGGLRVQDADGLLRPVPARKPAALFVLLALQPGRPQPRARLAALLWGSSGESAARASLRQALLVLRRALGLDDAELLAGPGETLGLAAGVAQVDALDLEAAGDPAAHDALLAGADGTFLEGLDTGETGFDDWLALQRARLRDRLVGLLAQRLAEQRAQGQADAAVATALRLLAHDPLREEVHCTLIELHAAQRRWSAALRQFQLCRDLLARELGVRPQPATLRLREAVERQREIAAGGAAPAAATTNAGTVDELRQVTLVACESDRAAAEADPERALALAERAAGRATEIAARFGGRAEPRPGGGLLVWFGTPIAHGDDAERAARCALRLVAELPELRVGLAAGVVLVAAGAAAGGVAAGAATSGVAAGGETASLAARLLGAAVAGEVLVAASTWRLLARAADGQRCADAALPEALRGAGAWRLAALRPVVRSAALVGRRAELAQFDTLAAACADTGRGAMLHLRGEAGIGKTRLVDEFRERAARRGFAVHAGSVLDFGSGAERDAVRALVVDLLGPDPGAATPAALAAAIAAACGADLVDAGDAAALHALVRQPLPAPLQAVADAADAAGRRRARRDTLRRLVERSAARAPRLLVLEDLHWADADTLADAATIAQATESAALLLVTTARSDADPLDAAWRQAAGLGGLATLDLGPLRWAEASALAAQTADIADAFTLGCVDRAAGHPLFLEQLLLGERGAGASLPATLQAVVQARLDRLAPPEREAVRVASVLGQRFALAALDHLLGAPAAWDARLAGGLLRTDGPDGAFAHALVHEGAYASLPRARRRVLHAAAAGWYAGRDAVLHAEQLERADDPAAGAAWLAAARGEADGHRHERAHPFAARGLALAATASVRFELACCAAEALHELGRNADAHAAWQHALAAADDDAQRCRAWTGAAATLRLRDDLDGAADALAQAERAAAARGLVEPLARVHLLRGNLLFPRGDLDGCRREHEAALALAQRAGSTELEVAALGGLGDAAYLGGRMLSARRRFADCVALARRHGLRRVEAANRPMAAYARWFAGDAAGALDEAVEAVASALAIGHLRAAAIGCHAAYQCRHGLMQFDAALADAGQALVLAQRAEAPRFEAEALAFRGETRAATGDRAGALADLQAALAIARATGMAYMGPIFLGMLALAAAGADEATRRAALAEAEQLLATNGLAHNHLLFRRSAIDACRIAGDAAAMRQHAAQLAQRTQAEPLPWSDFLVRRAQALADALEQGVDAARQAQLETLAAQGRGLGLDLDARALAQAAGAVSAPGSSTAPARRSRSSSRPGP
jgi:DNA-binding SARP family transcriptional activator